jgi:hypothetical protein
MSSTIFADHAQAYWAKGLPAIPLMQRDKRPAIDGWQYFADRLPTLGEQSHWLNSYAAGNIGLVLGAQSGLVMLDIDTEEQRLQAVIMECLQGFPSPWVRVGSKGMVLAYRQPKGQIMKTFRIRRIDCPKDSASVIEALSTRTQVVLPPSIHPKGMAYSENCSLLDVMDDLPYLPHEIEGVLRQALIAEGVELSQSGYTKVTDFVSAGARDNQQVAVAGLWAQGVTRGEITLLDAINRMHSWVENQVEKVAGDEIDVKKGVVQIVTFVSRDVMERKKVLPAGWDLGLDEETKKGLGLQFDITHEEWAFEQIMGYLLVEFEKHGSKGKGWIDCVEYILDRLSRSTNITGLYEERILKYIAECSNKEMTTAVLRKRMREMRSGSVKGEDHTEIAKASMIELSRFGEVRYAMSKFWRYSGSHWEVLEEDRLLLTVAENFGHLQAARKRGDHQGIVKVMATLCSKELIEHGMRGVNFANGFLTTDLKLLPHNAAFGCTYTLPFRYMPDDAHRCTKWLAFLDRSFSDPVEGPDADREEKIMAIQEAMCVTLFGMGPSYGRVVLLFGLAHTGKSELLKVVRELVPEQSRCAVAPNDWNDKFLPAQMAGKLLNIAGELSGQKKIDGQSFKRMVTSDPLTVQHKNGQPFEVLPTATHWFGANETPTTLDQTEGFNRRWLIVQFKSRISDAEKIVDIGNLLVAEEREQIVAWVVQAMRRLQETNVYTLPSSHTEVMREVANSNNSVRHFFLEGGVVKTVPPAPEGGTKTSHHTSEVKLYEAYLNFCYGMEGVKRAGLLQFRTRMHELEREMGFKIVTTPTDCGTVTDYYNLILVGLKPR